MEFLSNSVKVENGMSSTNQQSNPANADHSEAVTSEAKGSCLCGKVTFQATIKAGVGACHCGMCRKWSAGPFMAAHAVGEVDFTGLEYISRYSSSEWAERGFCTSCGSSLFYHLLPRAEVPAGEYILSAGLLSDQQALVFDHEVYIDHAPGWYGFAGEDGRHRMTEAELLAMFTSTE